MRSKSIFVLPVVLSIAVLVLCECTFASLTMGDFTSEATLINFNDLSPTTCEDIHIEFTDEYGENWEVDYPSFPNYSTVTDQYASLGVVFSQGDFTGGYVDLDGTQAYPSAGNIVLGSSPIDYYSYMDPTTWDEITPSGEGYLVALDDLGDYRDTANADIIATFLDPGSGAPGMVSKVGTWQFGYGDGPYSSNNPGLLTMTAYDVSGNVLDVALFPLDGSGSFTGIGHPAIHEIFIHSPSGDAFNIDDFMFEGLTPIPAPGAVVLGSMGIALVGWRCRRKTGCTANSGRT